MILLPIIIPIIVGLAQLSLARKADTRMYLDERHVVKSVGKETCAYCNWTGNPHCNTTAYWNSCTDNPTPNPCRADEIITLDSREVEITSSTMRIPAKRSAPASTATLIQTHTKQSAAAVRRVIYRASRRQRVVKTGAAASA